MDAEVELDDEGNPVVKEMFDMNIPRVDVVSGPASGLRFIVLKAGQAQDPEAIAAVTKAEKSTADINDLPDSDFAYIEPGGTKDESGKTTPRSKRHFPIMDAAHTRNALARAPQSPFGDKAMSKIRAAAKKFGIDTVTKQQEVPSPVSKKNDQSKPAPVTKADGDLDPTEVLAEPEEAAAGDASEPGSPAWEAVDAATARKWTAILARAKGALQVMSDRENQEVAVGSDDGDAADNAFDLEDACCAIDYAISVLAPFAVDEQSEADTASEAMDGVSKAMKASSGMEGALGVLEALGPVRKAGRVLSAANEAAIRGAVESLQKVLASLPAAPEDVTKSKEAIVEPEKPVIKAKGDPMVAIYDANGNLLGAVDQEDITPLSAGTPVDADKDAEPAPDAGDGSDAATADDGTAAAAPADGSAAPAGAAAPPAAPAAAPAEQQPVAKAAFDIAELVQKAVTEALKEAEEGHQEVVKQLEGRVAHLEAQPAPGGPLLAGLATGGGKIPLRGHDGSDGIPPELLAVQKQLEAAQASGNQVEIDRLKRMLVFETLKTGYGMQAPPVIPSGLTR